MMKFGVLSNFLNMERQRRQLNLCQHTVSSSQWLKNYANSVWFNVLNIEDNIHIYGHVNMCNIYFVCLISEVNLGTE